MTKFLLILIGFLLAVAVMVSGCSPTGGECAQAHAAHVHVRGC